MKKVDVSWIEELLTSDDDVMGVYIALTYLDWIYIEREIYLIRGLRYLE